LKFANELSDGEKVESVFAATEKQLKKTRQGKPFLSLKLADKTGSVEAVAWDNAESLSLKFEKGDIVAVRAEVGSYNGSLQLSVRDLKKVQAPEDYLERILPTTEKDVDAMLAELKTAAQSVRTDWIKGLLTGFLEDPVFVEKFRTAPAAKGMHHVFAGGLLQHTLKVVRLVSLIYEEYRASDPLVASMVDRDLLVAGALLHDIGKIEELSSGAGFDYTFRGKLLGHVTLGLMALKEKLDGIPEKDPEKADLLMHMVISHHGEYNLDAKLQGLAEFADKDVQEGKFTAWHRLYDRQFYKGGGTDK
jgi:3'-5' exoribonuclease